MNRAFHIAGWGYVVACVALLLSPLRSNVARTSFAGTGGASVGASSSAAEWFRRAKPYCNAVEVASLAQRAEAPRTAEGQGYRAACFALAGRIDDARRVIDALPADQHAQAAGVVFAVGHPVADAGDDRSAGPIMELVVDYWPNHYMALYHAGMAEYMLGQHDLARHNLDAFLRLYTQDDGWRSNALDVIARLDDPNGRGRESYRRPREPGT